MVSKKGQEGGYKSSYNEVGSSSPSKAIAKKLSNNKTNAALIMPMSHFGGNNIWILKPTCQNRGKGIHVVSSMKKLKKLIKDYVFGREYSIPAGTGAPPVMALTKQPWQIQSTGVVGVASPPQKNFLTGIKNTNGLP